MRCGSLVGSSSDAGEGNLGDSDTRGTNGDAEIPDLTVGDVVNPSMDEDGLGRSTLTGATFSTSGRVASGNGGEVLYKR